jgi:lipopolysaccharide biosynthesis glycosyltransferase
MTLRVFIGYDARQPISYTVLQYSIVKNSSKPVSLAALNIKHSPGLRCGLTPFTFSRFLVPYLCNYEGWALFLDIDILVKGDIAELFSFADDKYAVMVSKNEKHRFEWASVMLFNCAKCKALTPDVVNTKDGLHGINWVPDEEIGDLPREWNHLVGYDEPRENPKLIHYTQGVPLFQEVGPCEHRDIWHEYAQEAVSSVPWIELMGGSVHATDCDGRRISKQEARRLKQLQK